MPNRLHHEQIYRGNEVIHKLSKASVHFCGAGAIGSNLVMHIARCGLANLTIIDRDRVEEHNIGTQTYALDDVGAQKAEILRNNLYRELGVDAQAHAGDLNDRNIPKILKGAQLVVDTFDNSSSRKLVADYCLSNKINCLHAGVNDEYGEVVWSESYRVPSDAGVDACDYPLARNLIILVAAVASEVLVRFIATGSKENYSITLGDLSINQEHRD